ncbi:DUF4132 domain-containing protein [Spirillospora sp. NPDC029432]|uniref:DUF4132 domain-containing protein n=1 Tax=Spirillospora sp. NPDC029432 TaxID=3154599 RepID=UPI003456C0AB
MIDHPPPAEDVLTIPPGWRRGIHPRHGGIAGPRIALGAAAAEPPARALDEARADVERLLADPATAPALVAAARAHLDGTPDPLGAAVLARITGGWAGSSVRSHEFVDAWAFEHGAAFAARAFTEWCALEAAWEQPRGARERHCAQIGYAPRGTVDARAAHRARSLLAAASEEEYAEAWRRLAEHRRTHVQCYVTAYLLPGRRDWVTELCRDPDEVPRVLLFASLGTPDQLDLLGDWATLTIPDCYEKETLRTLAEGLGTAAAPLLADALDRMVEDATRCKNLAEALAVLPSDEAFRALVRHRGNRHVSAALAKAAERFPARAARELGTGGPATDGDLDGVPAVLADAPWTREPERPEPVVVTGLPVPEPHMAWDGGEAEAWRKAAWFPIPSGWYGDGAARGPWDGRIADFEAGRLASHQQVALLLLAPVEEVRHLLDGWYPARDDHTAETTEHWVPSLAARFGLDALDAVLKGARKRPGKCGHAVVPYAAEPVALLVSDWLLRVKSGRPHAEAWLRRHGAGAVRLLLPAALGKPGKRRDAAERALHFLAGELGHETVVEAAPDQRAALGTLLDSGPRELAPRKVPEVGPFADPSALPPVRLRTGGRALPATAVRNLLTLLAMPDAPGLDEVREACDAESLAAFAWALFERWREYGEAPGGAWALTAAGLLGDDAAARRLEPIIRAWPGENGHHKAVRGLDALALIGSETALMLLDGIARKSGFKAIKVRAGEKIEEVAGRLGLTGEQLADRLVPGYGLDADGGMTLDYGPRRFTVGFDEQLKPYVTDAEGRRRAALPKPGAKDDPDLAPAAHAAFSRLKKDVRAAVPNQVRRLELAMTTGRAWTLAEFRDLLVHHPLMWHLVRRLVWAADGTAFRLAEDRTFADIDDKAFTPDENATITLPHAVSLDRAWRHVLADYEIVQPFPQVDRPVHHLTGDERGAVRLARFEGRTAPWGKVLGLQKRGWYRGEPQDNGTERWISRPVPGGLHVVIGLDPGIQVGYGDQNEDQILDVVWLAAEPGDFRGGDDHPRFGGLDAVTVSEVLADLAAITES